MAKIVYGGGVAAASGKLAGQVFSRNKGGSYLRQFVKPTNPRTALQLNARDRLSQYANEFRTLTQPQQNSWLTYANAHPVVDRLGNVIKLTAMQAYVKINTNRDINDDFAVNSTVPNEPVFTTDIVNAFADLTLTIAPPVATFMLGAGAAPGQQLAVYCSPPVSAGINNTAAVERFLYSKQVSATDPATGYISIYADLILRFGAGAYMLGKKIVINVYQYDQGQLGAANRVSGIIAA